SVIGTDRKLRRKRHNLLAGVLRLGFAGVRAVSKKDVSFALSHQGPVNRAARRCDRRIGSAGQPQRFPLQRRKRAGPEPIGLAKHLPGVVAGGICTRRGGAEFHARVEHAVENCSRLDGNSRPHQGAQPVAREKHAGPLLPAVANACGCSILAEANTSACAPPAISSFSVPDGPYLACTFCPNAASNASVTSVRAVRRLPAAWSKTGSDASAGTAIVVAARMAARRTSIMPPVHWHWGKTTPARGSCNPQSPFALRAKRAS